MSESAEQQAYHQIKSAIYKKYIQQGSKLAEASLAQKLNLSRTPVRGAIKRLAYEGLVEISENRRARVIRPTEKEIRQTFAVRAQLEKMAAELAAPNFTPADVKKLRDLASKETHIFQEFEKKRGKEEYYEVNDTIHLHIAKLSGNDVLYSHIESLLQKSKIFLVLFDPYDQMSFNSSPGEHEDIINRLAAGDSAGAGNAMEEHMKSTLDGMDFDKARPEDDFIL